MRSIKQSEPLREDTGGFINGSGMGVETLGKTLKFDSKVAFRHKPYANDIAEVRKEIERDEEEKRLRAEQTLEVPFC